MRDRDKSRESGAIVRDKEREKIRREGGRYGAQQNTAQYSTVQHNTAQHNTSHHNTIHDSYLYLHTADP